MERSEGDLIATAVKLGNAIRQQRTDGNLQSIAPPTIYGYLAFVRMAQVLPHLSLQQIAQVTLLGNANGEDRKHVGHVLSSVFGLQGAREDDPAMGGKYF